MIRSGWFGIALLMPGLAMAQVADQIWLNAHVWTGDSTKPIARALASKGDRLLAVGSRSEVLAFTGPATTKTNLCGRRVVPGFNDAHAHFGLAPLNGFSESGSVLEIQRRLRALVKDLPPGGWLIDGGWAHADWPDRRPNRRFLDEVVSDRPVLLFGRDGHMVLANSVAIGLAGITVDSKDPDEGRIVRDGAGIPTGELTGKAMSLVNKIVPAPDVATIVAWFRRDLDEAASWGITSAQMMHGFDASTDGALQRVVQSGQLKVRLALAANLPAAGLAFESDLTLAREQRARWQGPLVKFGVVKGVLDGTIDARTGHMLQPFTDGSNGFGYYSDEQLGRLVAAYDKEGFQIALHATGDRAIRQALDAFEQAARENGPRMRRPRIEHIDVPTVTDLPRLRPLGVIPSSQPNFAYPDATNLGNYAVLLGERMQHAQVYATLDRWSPVQPFGSDHPVSSMNVLKAIHTSVARTDSTGFPRGGWYPTERISTEAALRHFTADGAYASFEEADKGTLSAGKLADFVVLSDDVLASPATLKKAKVVMTVMGARTTFRANAMRSCRGAVVNP